MAEDQAQLDRLTAVFGEEEAKLTVSNWSKLAEIKGAQEALAEATETLQIADEGAKTDAEAAVAKAKQALEGADDMPGLTEELNAINGEIAVLEALDDQALAIVALSQSNGDFAQLSGKVAELNEARSIKLAEWQAKQAPVQKQVGSRRTSDLRSLGWMSIWGKPALFAAVIMIFFVLLFRENGNAKNQDNES
jgi:hypothetical protein